MTDLAITTAPADTTTPRPKRKLLRLALPLLLAGAGFGTTYMGLWSPMSLLGGAQTEAAAPEAAHATGPHTVFIDVPPFTLTIPDARPRMLHLVVKLEAPADVAATAHERMPRILDATVTFLSGIAPAAYDRRGILEVIREELRTRINLALATGTDVDVLIMEFALK